MLCVKVMNHLQGLIKPLIISTRELNTTPMLLHKGWRLANGYPEKWSDRGILTDGPDFSYGDKPTPYTNGQRQRLLQQKKYAERIIYLLKVIDYAKKSYQARIRHAAEEKESIIAKKLKPKGNLLKKKASIE